MANSDRSLLGPDWLIYSPETVKSVVTITVDALISFGVPLLSRWEADERLYGEVMATKDPVNCGTVGASLAYKIEGVASALKLVDDSLGRTTDDEGRLVLEKFRAGITRLRPEG